MKNGVPTCAEENRRGYRVAEAARYMGVNPWFVEVELRAGRLRGLKMCRHWTILKEDMDAFLDAQCEAVKAA